MTATVMGVIGGCGSLGRSGNLNFRRSDVPIVLKSAANEGHRDEGQSDGSLFNKVCPRSIWVNDLGDQRRLRQQCPGHHHQRVEQRERHPGALAKPKSQIGPSNEKQKEAHPEQWADQRPREREQRDGHLRERGDQLPQCRDKGVELIHGIPFIPNDKDAPTLHPRSWHSSGSMDRSATSRGPGCRLLVSSLPFVGSLPTASPNHAERSSPDLRRRRRHLFPDGVGVQPAGFLPGSLASPLPTTYNLASESAPLDPKW